MAHAFPTVPVRSLGSQGLKASAQGLGCMGMSAFYSDLTSGDDAASSHRTEENGIKTIHRAQELGVTLLDTSDIYGPFTNEELVGKAIKGRRDRYIIATKFGITFKDGKMANDGSRKHTREACEASLKRLGIDYIDLYYLHRVDPNTPVEETFAELKLLVEEGKVRYLGISEATAEQIRAAHAVAPLTAVQMEWSLFTREHERDIIPVCRELGIGIVAYSPLGRGFLTGTIKKADQLSKGDYRANNPRFAGDNFDKNVALVQRVEEIAQRKGCTPAQLALAWVHAQGDDVFPIPGTTKVHYLEQNIKALGVHLTKEDLQEIAAAVPESEVAGTRYGNMTSRT